MYLPENITNLDKIVPMSRDNLWQASSPVLLADALYGLVSGLRISPRTIGARSSSFERESAVLVAVCGVQRHE